MSAPDPVQCALVIDSGKGRVQRIADGLFGAPQTDVIRSVGLRAFGPPIDVSAATDSATRQHRGALGHALKTRFLKGQANWLHRRLARSHAQTVVVWNGLKGHRRLAADIAAAGSKQVLFLEEAPLPGRITADFNGVNFRNSLPRRADFYAAWAQRTGAALDDWQKIGGAITPRKARSGSAVGQDDGADSLGEEPFIFVPLQVPGDSQITVFGDWIDSVEHMIDVLAQASRSLPDGWHLRIKEHPSAKDSFAAKLAALQSPKLRVDNKTNTMAQVAASRGVITINSSVGFEAFFKDVPVVVLGHAFYGFDGMAQKVASQADLNAALSAPQALHFDDVARAAFGTYLDQAYFPREADILSGAYTIRDLVARDDQAADILASLAK